jgi:hemoglobin-like flavoprotein
MTNEQIKLVKSTWKVLEKIDPIFLGDIFYSKLFYDHPEVRPLFPRQMNEQFLKLMRMLSLIISRLDNLETVLSEIESLARRHVKYGVIPSHYKYVGDALLWTLRNGLGKDWNASLEEAWSACYSAMANAMLKALEDQKV